MHVLVGPSSVGVDVAYLVQRLGVLGDLFFGVT